MGGSVVFGALLGFKVGLTVGTFVVVGASVGDFVGGKVISKNGVDPLHFPSQSKDRHSSTIGLLQLYAVSNFDPVGQTKQSQFNSSSYVISSQLVSYNDKSHPHKPFWDATA